MDRVSEDILENILSRIPAQTFARSTCVSKSWNFVSNQILYRPKLSSALSLNPSFPDAIEEVLDKVLSEPIRPHFALASIGSFNLKLTHEIITKRLGLKTPVITCVASGIIGRDACTNEFREVKWETTDDGDGLNEQGIVLTVGFFPGIKVDVIPLFRKIEQSQVSMVDKFVREIKDCTNPDAILMFGAHNVDMKPILNTLDSSLPIETTIVGDAGSNFLYSFENNSRNTYESTHFVTDAVALIFSRDPNKSCGTGVTQFFFGLSTGLSTVGPIYKTASVRENGPDESTWLTARVHGSNEILDGQRILNDISDELAYHAIANEFPDLYIGVMERRKYMLESRKVRLLTSLAFHEVLGGDEQDLYVSGVGIRTGDTFQIFHADSNAALSSCNDVCLNLKNYAQLGEDNERNKKSKEVFGGFVFSCCGRGESFFECSNVDSSPFTDNFPGVPISGQFCCGEIGRCSSSLILRNIEQNSTRCSLHVYSTVYLVMSYTPFQGH